MLKQIAALWCLLVASACAQPYPPQVSAINPTAFIRAVDLPAAEALRADLIEQVFNAVAIDTTPMPAYYNTFNPAGTTWAGALNMASIQEWRVTVSRGFVSRLFRFMPTIYRNPSSGKGGVVVAAGHGHIGTQGPYTDPIKWLVASGYEVWTVDMPLSGLNVGPVVVDDPNVGKLQLSNHDQMQVMHTPDFNPLRIFLEPVAAIVNDMAARGVTNVGMFGLSGGGWTTDLYAALDPRIRASYSIAGSMPIYARSWAPPNISIGDWEQRIPPALGVDYMDLYVLASMGAGRRHVNIHNAGDDCCFGGTVANHYAAAVKAAVASVGSGSFDVVIDTTATSHTITPWAANWFLLDQASRF